MGTFLMIPGVVELGDWVLSTHQAGGFHRYLNPTLKPRKVLFSDEGTLRSLDLTTDIAENAGATVLSTGSYMQLAEVSKALADYHVNALTEDGSQIIQAVQHISTTAQDIEVVSVLKMPFILPSFWPIPKRGFIKAVYGKISESYLS
ncbi:uncharacterized protein N7503_009361 [Penicillium pulvis]|uniref:uncharacterized protein n=1 Tax=Penicillium pulvis TaxID=1562058 RepID=UPI002547E068|nr:uncharacterized protein N7503_009361 [Penicillium pulvis]KAJ5793383.1 hypothetical protein N7503_009361 [Penicillium pulvis]